MARITPNICTIDGMEHPFGVGVVPCIVEGRNSQDLTLVDTFFLAEFPKFKAKLIDEGYDIKSIKRIILTHTHVDHIQSANEVKKASNARIYAHWVEAGYLGRNPPYNGPPNHETILKILDGLGIEMEEVEKKFKTLAADPVYVDWVLEDGDSVGRLKVIHSPGHTPGHVSLYSEEDRTLIGGDFLFKSVLGIEGLFVPSPNISVDPLLGAVSARRISKLHFDKLILGHQDSPLLEDAARAVEKVAIKAIDENKKKL